LGGQTARSQPHIGGVVRIFYFENLSHIQAKFLNFVTIVQFKTPPVQTSDKCPTFDTYHTRPPNDHYFVFSGPHKRSSRGVIYILKKIEVIFRQCRQYKLYRGRQGSADQLHASKGITQERAEKNALGRVVEISISENPMKMQK